MDIKLYNFYLKVHAAGDFLEDGHFADNTLHKWRDERDSIGEGSSARRRELYEYTKAKEDATIIKDSPLYKALGENNDN